MMWMTVNFSSENHGSQKEVAHLKSAEGKEPLTQSSTSNKKNLRNEGELKTFSNEGYWREVIVSRCALKELLKESHQIEYDIGRELETLGMKSNRNGKYLDKY